MAATRSGRINTIPAKESESGKEEGVKGKAKAQGTRNAKGKRMASSSGSHAPPKASVVRRKSLDEPSIFEGTSTSNLNSKQLSKAASPDRLFTATKRKKQSKEPSRTHSSSPSPSSSPHGIAVYLANAKKAREQFGANPSSSPNPLFNHLLPSEPQLDSSLSVRPDSPETAQEADDGDDSSEIEYVDESFVVVGRSRTPEMDDAGEADEVEVEEEQDDDKENQPSQLSLKPATPARFAKDDQPGHSTPIPPQHSTPINSAIRPQRSAGPRSALRPLELEGSFVSTHIRPKSFLDEALDLSQPSGEDGYSNNNGHAPLSSQSKKQTIAQIRTAAHAREQAKMAADQGDVVYWEENNMNAADVDQSDRESEAANEEDPFGFFTTLKTRKRKPESEADIGRDAKKAQTSTDTIDDKSNSLPGSESGRDEMLDGEGRRVSSKTSEATHQIKSARVPASSPAATDRQGNREISAASDQSSADSLPAVRDLLNTDAQAEQKATSDLSDKERKERTPSPTRSPSPSTSELQVASNLNSQTPSQQSAKDQPPSSPIFDVVLPPRDGRKLRAKCAAVSSSKPKIKTQAAKNGGKELNKGKQVKRDVDELDQSRLKIDDLVGLLPGRKSRSAESFSPPPGSRSSRAKAQTKSKVATGVSRKLVASAKKGLSKKDQSSDDEDDIFNPSEEDDDHKQSKLADQRTRVPLKSKSTNARGKAGKSGVKSASSKPTAQKTSSTMTSNFKKAATSLKKQAQSSKGSKRSKKDGMQVMIIINNSDGDSDEEESSGSSDDGTDEEHAAAANHRSADVQKSKKRKNTKSLKEDNAGSESDQEDAPTSGLPNKQEARKKRLKAYDALDDYQLAEEKVLF